MAGIELTAIPLPLPPTVSVGVVTALPMDCGVTEMFPLVMTRACPATSVSGQTAVTSRTPLLFAAARRSLELRGDTIQITNTRGERHEVDFVIVGTGFVTDLARRPELRAVEPHIARWADRYQPPEGEQHADLSRHPYLGPGFQFTERRPGEAPYLRTLYNYTFGGLLSLGFGGASISGMKYSVPRLVAGITGSLFVEDRQAHYDSLRAFAEVEF